MGMNVEEEIRGLGFMRRAVSIGGPFSSNYVSGIIVNIINHLEAGEISPIARVNSYSYIFLNILLGKIGETSCQVFGNSSQNRKAEQIGLGPAFRDI